MSKIVTVFGATGNQGGSVIAAIQRNSTLSQAYKIRAVTRDTTKDAAKKLAASGAEVVKADLNDVASVREAVKGAHAVFGVTNFWEGMDGASEEKQGRNIADASVAEGVKLFVFSSLPNVTKLSGGKLTHVSHFDGKAAVEEYARTLPLTSTFFWPAYFMSNFLKSGPRPNGDGTYTLANVWKPNSQVPILDVAADTGKFVVPALLDFANDDTAGAHQRWNGRRIYGAAAFYTPAHLAAHFTAATGKTVTYSQIPDDAYAAALPPRVARELLENMILVREHAYYGAGDDNTTTASKADPSGAHAQQQLAATLATLVEPATSFPAWLAKHKWFQ